MPKDKDIFLGLNQTGVIVFIALLIFTGPCFCWVPWLIDACKGEPQGP
jgi:hypothetical protein